jgi:hypothetical protein
MKKDPFKSVGSFLMDVAAMLILRPGPQQPNGRKDLRFCLTMSTSSMACQWLQRENEPEVIMTAIGSSITKSNVSVIQS